MIIGGASDDIDKLHVSLRLYWKWLSQRELPALGTLRSSFPGPATYAEIAHRLFTHGSPHEPDELFRFRVRRQTQTNAP